MNLIEHYIKEIHNVTDVTSECKEINGCPPNETIYEVDLTYVCCGQAHRTIKIFSKSEWKSARSKGYFMDGYQTE